MQRFWENYKSDYKKILKLGLPILIGQLGMIVVGFADNIMVGRYSTAALASASLVNNLFNVAIFACLGFTYGLTPLIGALYAQKRDGAIGSLLKNGLLLNTFFSIGVILIMGVIYLNLERMGQPEELMPLIKPYYLIYLAGLLPVALFNVYAQWAYAINRTQMPMWIILSANLLNVAGNYMLIYGHCGFPELGLTGAGISTFVARWLSAFMIMGVFFFMKRFRGYSAGFLSGRINGEEMGRVNRTSWPVSIQMVFESGSFTFAAVMAGWLGAVPLAAFQIIVITGTLGFCVYYSMASAVSVLVSNAAGRADRHGMRKVAFAGYHIMLTLASVSSLIFLLFEHKMIEAFTEDTAVIATTMTLIFPLVLYQLGDATQITFANALRGTSRVAPMIWIAGVSYVAVGLPATYILGFPAGLGIYGILLSFSVSLFLAAGLFLWQFMRVTSAGRSIVE